MIDRLHGKITEIAKSRKTGASCGSANQVPGREKAVTDKERRKDEVPITDVLHSELNEEQRAALDELEKYGWELRFVRHDPEQAPVTVIFDAEHDKFAVLEADGSLNEKAFINIRH